MSKWDNKLPLDDKCLLFFSSCKDDVLYEVHANSDHWMIAGRKRGHVLLSTKQGFFKLFFSLFDFQLVLQVLLCTYMCSAGSHAFLYSARIENNYFSIMLATGCWICSSSSVGVAKCWQGQYLLQSSQSTFGVRLPSSFEFFFLHTSLKPLVILLTFLYNWIDRPFSFKAWWASHGRLNLKTSSLPVFVQYVFFFQVATVKEASFFIVKDVDLMYREHFCLYNRWDSEREFPCTRKSSRE